MPILSFPLAPADQLANLGQMLPYRIMSFKSTNYITRFLSALLKIIHKDRKENSKTEHKA